MPSVVEEPLVRSKLTRFATPAKACKELDRFRDDPIWLRYPSTRTGCRVRPVSPGAPASGRHSPQRPSLIEFSRTRKFPRHADVSSVVSALAFPVGTAWLVALDSVEKSRGIQMLPLDASGSVDVVSVEHIDLVGTEVPELVFVLAIAAHRLTYTTKFMDLIICDSGGAWCTKPVKLGLDCPHWNPMTYWEDECRRERSELTSPPYAFRRDPRGVLVVTSGDPPVPDRLFPLDDTK
jgi:hypothetical protein